MGLTRYRAHWIVPVSGAPIRNGALLVGDDGRITAVGADAEVPAPAGATAVDLGDAALLPGLVNVHAHPELTVLRGSLEDLPFEQWIPRLRLLKRDAALSAEDLRVSASWQLLEAHAAGVTTIAATEDSDATFVALLQSGGRGVVYRETFAPAPHQSDTALAVLRQHVDSMRAQENALVRVGVSPHTPFTVSDAHFAAVAEYAREENLAVAVHIAESAAEVALVTSASGAFADELRRRGINVTVRAESPIALLERLGVLAAKPLLIHCVLVGERDIDRIAAHGATVAHCPIANARLGHGIAPAAAMQTAGITVGLGSDSMASNNRMDMLEEARAAQLMQRSRLQSPTVLDAASVLRMATLDGARALGLDEWIGTLEPGKDADLCAVSLAGMHARPAPDPVVALVHSTRASDVVLTAVRGRVLYERGTHSTIDRAATQLAFEAVAARVAAAAAAAA